MQIYYIIKPIWIGDRNICNCPLYVENEGRCSQVWTSLPDGLNEIEDPLIWSSDTIKLWLESEHLLPSGSKQQVHSNAMGDIDAGTGHGTWLTLYNMPTMGVVCSEIYDTELRAKKQVYLFQDVSSWIIHAPEPILNEIISTIEWNNYINDAYIESFISNWKNHPVTLRKIK